MRIPPAESLPVYDRLLIDASHHLWRVLWGFYRSGAHDIVQGACISFLKSVMRDMNHARTRCPFVCWESQEKKNWKIGIQGYKVREQKEEGPTYEQYAECAKLLQKTLRRIGIHQAYSVGHEADETIAALTHDAVLCKETTVISSADHDFHQLTSLPGVKVLCFKDDKANILDKETVSAMYGVPPDLLPTVFALCGDSSDSLKGIFGVGLTTATRIVFEIGALKDWEKGFPESVNGLAPRLASKLVEDGIGRIRERYQLVDLLNSKTLPRTRIIYPDIEESGAPFDIWFTLLSEEYKKHATSTHCSIQE